MPRRLLPLLPALLLLSACEAELTVDLAASPPVTARSVVLGVDAVQALTAGGEIRNLDVDGLEAIDLGDYSDGTRLNLAGDRGEAAYFTGWRPGFVTDTAYVEAADGSRTALTLEDEGAYAELDLSLDDDESATVVLTLELPFSLIDRRADLGQYQLRPVLRAALADSAGDLEGEIARAVLDASGCRQGRARGQGVAVYVYVGADRTPVDYYADGTVTRLHPPIATAPVRYDTASDRYGYAVHHLPPGDYTVALTCEADAEHPRQDDDLAFVEAHTVELDARGTAVVDFES
jgi:hypothetical protein